MKGLLGFMPMGAMCEILRHRCRAQQRVRLGVFSGTHTGQGGPCPPTGKSTNTDYVYVMEFAGDKIRHMTKIWNAGWAMRDLGWG